MLLFYVFICHLLSAIASLPVFATPKTTTHTNGSFQSRTDNKVGKFFTN